jgi:predicted HD superfamily hydrolase involved in NAD metabolism
MLNYYIGDFKATGKTEEDVPRFLISLGHQKTAEHCFAVATKAKELAERFGCNLPKAEQAGYLHDISAIIPNEKRIDFAQSQSVKILAEEIQHPMVIHQKLSVILAREVFGVTDNEVLGAIGCHTTLRADPTLLDKVVFLADKIAWDHDGKPPYISKINDAMEKSLDAAVMEYIMYLWERRSQLKVVHPWLVEAHEYFGKQSSNDLMPVLWISRMAHERG